ncbi:MAG: hypothetical protein ACO3CQ_06485, partial [Candidatus Nanopelagicaceae bacterium]
MATDKPLILRRQKGKTVIKPRQSLDSLQVEVLVDTGVFHLEQPFTYFLPEELKELIDVGSLVRVPFKNDLKNGVVLSVKNKSQAALKPIDSLLTSVRLTPGFLEFTKKVSERYIANQASILAAVLPTFTKAISPSIGAPLIKKTSGAKPTRQLFLLSRSESIESRVLKIIRERKGLNLLLILPTQKEIEKVIKALGEMKQEVIEIGSHLTSSQRRKNFELAA